MRRGKNWLEWSVFALGLVLVASTIGYLTYEALTHGVEPPDLHLTLGEPRQSAGRYIVPVLITNRGDTTAEDVHIEVRRRGQDGKEERAELEFPFVPRHARRNGWIMFQTDPANGGRLEGIVLGYREN